MSLLLCFNSSNAALPPDLQKIVGDDAASVSAQIVPFVNGFFAAQRKAWTDMGGELIALPTAGQDAMLAKISSIGNDLSKVRPALNEAVDLAFKAAARNK